jgi:phosphoserine phosphatase RsbU/P
MAMTTKPVARCDSRAEGPPSVRNVTPGQDLRSAARVQDQLLPPSIYTGRYIDLAAKASPCRIVGGDFFDYQDAGGEFRVALGDVCGKGAPAAIQAALVQGVLAIEAEGNDGASSAMAHLNRALCRRAVAGRFVTMFMGVVTPQGRLSYCNAGQCSPILVNHQSVRSLSVGGCPLGLFPDATYEEESVAMIPGDTLVVFSDGVTEARGCAENLNEEFGEMRVLEAVREHREATASAILDHLLAKLRGFARQRQHRDDVTALVMRYRGEREEAGRPGKPGTDSRLV